MINQTFIELFFAKMCELFLRLNQMAEYYGVKKPSEFAKKTGLSCSVMHLLLVCYFSNSNIPFLAQCGAI